MNDSALISSLVVIIIALGYRFLNKKNDKKERP